MRSHLRALLALALASTSVFASACGSPPKVDAAPQPDPSANATRGAGASEGNDSGAENVAASADAATGPTSSDTATVPASPNGATASPPSTAGIIAEGHDECTGIAAPFEEKVRAKFNECYQAGKKKNPELAGTIKVTLKIDAKGKVTKYVPDKSKLDAPVVDCMVKAVKKEPFAGKACSGKDITVSKTFGGVR